MIAGRHPTGFGNTPTYHPVNRLAVPEAAMRINQKTYFHPIMKQGQWVVKKLNFSLNDSVTIRTRVTGVGMGYLYASFDNGEGPSLLTIKKVTPGFHDLKFNVPYPTLKGFRVGISTTSPKGYTIDRLSKEDKYRLSTNSMMVSQSAPMYESPSIGFAGLGALLDHSGPAKGGEDSAKNPYWDGNFDNFSWKNGFSGRPASSMNCVDTSTPAPRGSYHGYYAHRASYALAKFDAQESFLGWDMVEEQGYGLPAGVPICIVMQFFVLPKKTKSGGNKSGMADREMKDPYWTYAHDYQIPAGDFHLLESNCATLTRQPKKPPNSDPRPASKKKGPIFNVGKWQVVSTEYEGSGFMFNNTLQDARDIAAKVEWYNETSGSWSAPSRAPPSIPKTNENGFTKVIFRVPRQLSKETDKDMLAELTNLGVDYSYETNKNNYPAYDWTSDEAKYNPKGAPACSVILGRPLPDDVALSYQEAGLNYLAVNKLALTAYFCYGSHPYAGKAGNENGGPKPGHLDLEIPSMTFSDAEKMARMNNPELLNAFYPVGGFKTGGVIIAIGRGMSLKSHFVMTNSGTTTINNVHINPSPVTDGSSIGNYPACVLRPDGIILSTDLADDRAATGEEAVLAAWKAKFGTPLTAQFFSDYSFKDQDTTRPTHYKVKDIASGVMIQAPYQIIYFKVGPGYSGPYVDYKEVTEEETKDGETFTVTKLKITKPEGKKYALGKGDSLWLHCRTPYMKYTKQNIDIIEEVVEQRELQASGLTDLETLVYNPLNDAPEEITAAAAEAAQEAQRLTDLALLEPGTSGPPGVSVPEPPKPKLPRGAKYVRSGDKWRLNPKHYARKSELEDAGFLSGIKSALGGFTNSRDFYVEDVTQKWGASGSTALGGLGYGYDDFASDVLEDTGAVLSDVTNALAYGVGTVFETDFDSRIRKFKKARSNAFDLPSSTATLVTSTPANVLRVADDLVEDMIGLGGYSGLGETTADKLERYGENTTSFAKGAAKGIIPDKIQEGFGSSIDAIVDTFNKRPVLYTAIGLASVPLLIPGIGGAYAKNMTTVAGGAISLVPKAFRAGVDTVSGVSSGTIKGIKDVGATIAGSPSTRGTAARRRRNKRR
jgi:hypothetical protein